MVFYLNLIILFYYLIIIGRKLILIYKNNEKLKLLLPNPVVRDKIISVLLIFINGNNNK